MSLELCWRRNVLLTRCREVPRLSLFVFLESTSNKTKRNKVRKDKCYNCKDTTTNHHVFSWPDKIFQKTKTPLSIKSLVYYCFSLCLSMFQKFERVYFTNFIYTEVYHFYMQINWNLQKIWLNIFICVS